MSNWLPQKKRAILLNALLDGLSTRATAKLVPCSKVTVSRYRTLLAAAEFIGEDDARLPKCECGQPSGHRGWCRVRFERSPKRQEFMKRWNRL